MNEPDLETWEDDEENEEEEEEVWLGEEAVLALRHLEAPSLKAAVKAGPERLETYLRGEVGRPGWMSSPNLDSEASAELAEQCAEAEAEMLEKFSALTPQESEAILETLLRIDPEGTLRSEFLSVANPARLA